MIFLSSSGFLFSTLFFFWYLWRNSLPLFASAFGFHAWLIVNWFNSFHICYFVSQIDFNILLLDSPGCEKLKKTWFYFCDEFIFFRFIEINVNTWIYLLNLEKFFSIHHIQLHYVSYCIKTFNMKRKWMPKFMCSRWFQWNEKT